MALDPVRKPSTDAVAEALDSKPGPSLSVARPAWETVYAQWVVVSDVIAVGLVGAVGAGLIARSAEPLFAMASGVLFAVATLLTMYLAGAWDASTYGCGGAEYSRLVRGFALAAAALALAGLAARTDYIRVWVFGAVPLAGVLALAGRVGLRQWLHRRRRAGECSYPILAVGSHTAVADLVSRTRRDRNHGWTVTAACTPQGTGVVLGVPVVGDLDDVASVARRGEHRIVSVGGGPGWTSSRLNRLAWDIEEIGAEMVVDPALVEVAGPRLRTAPVDGLPLLTVSRPTLGRAGAFAKAVTDRACATVLLLVLAPLLLGLAFAIRSGGGPVLHRETRIGRGGAPFTLLRFRSVVADPEPRITAVGSWMRRY